MIAATENNDVEKIKLLLASGESVNSTDKFGRIPLHVAIKKERKDAFNFLLSVDGIQLELTVDCFGLTLLGQAFFARDDYFVMELINKGVNVNGNWNGFNNGNSILHEAVYQRRTAIAHCLLKNGANMNGTDRWLGETPLMIACKRGANELICMLLYYGADASIRDLSGKTAFAHYREYTRWCRRNDRRTIKNLEYTLLETTFDDKATVSLSLLCEVMFNGSPLFPRLLEKTEKVWYGPIYSCRYQCLATISPEYFKLFVTKFPHAVAEITRNDYYREKLSMQPEILAILCEHSFKPTLTSFFLRCHSTILPTIAEHLLSTAHSRSWRDTEGAIFCLLSYGLPVKSNYFYDVYLKSGYSSLFKLMLQLDHNFVTNRNLDKIEKIMCSMIVDYTATFRNFPYSCHGVQARRMRELLTYSSAPKLKAVCLRFNDDDLDETVKTLPQVPSLLELARDSFRGSLVTHCKPTSTTQLKAPGYCRRSTGINCKQFYTIIQNLPIPDVCKKVLTYERRLYAFN